METLTLEKAQALVQEIIAENGGSEAKYERPDMASGCQYVHRFNADGELVNAWDAHESVVRREWGCLVGRVLGKAGVPIEWFNSDRENYFSRSHVCELSEAGILDVDRDAENYLHSIQNRQDYGHTWVDADKYARAYAC